MGKSAGEVRSEIEDTRQEMSGTIDAIADRASPARIIRRRSDRIGDRWRAVRERVMGRAEDAHDVAGSARDRAGTVVEQTRQAPDKVLERTQGNPLAAGLIAFGGGLLLASLIPPSNAEQRVAGQVAEKAQPLRDELQRAGQDVAEDLHSTAQEGAEQVKQRASEAAETVQEDVLTSASSVKEEAQHSSP
jgi:gas vesicle protein